MRWECTNYRSSSRHLSKLAATKVGSVGRRSFQLSNKDSLPMLKSLNPLSLSLSLLLLRNSSHSSQFGLQQATSTSLFSFSCAESHAVLLFSLLQWCNLNAQAKQETSKQAGPRVGWSLGHPHLLGVRVTPNSHFAPKPTAELAQFCKPPLS